VSGQWRQGHPNTGSSPHTVTEMNRICLVLFDMNNKIFGPAAAHIPADIGSSIDTAVSSNGSCIATEQHI
jgi:hypothetical protein